MAMTLKILAGENSSHFLPNYITLSFLQFCAVRLIPLPRRLQLKMSISIGNSRNSLFCAFLIVNVCCELSTPVVSFKKKCFPRGGRV